MGDALSGAAAAKGIAALIKAGAAMAEVGQLGEEWKAKNTEEQLGIISANEQAKDALWRGSYEESRYRQQAGRAIQKAQMQYGASGVDATVGTPALVAADARAMEARDALTLRNNTYREAMGYRSTADKHRRQIDANAAYYRGKMTATTLSALGEFLESGADMAKIL